MTVNIRSAAAVGIAKLVEPALLPATTETAVLTAAAGTSIQVTSAELTNVSGSSVNVWVSVVSAGGTAGDSNRKRHNVAIAAGATLDIGIADLDEGDFISMKASAGSAIAVVLCGYRYSNATGAVMSGVHRDYTGSGAHGLSGSLTPETIRVSSLPNRRLATALMVQQGTTSFGWASYTGGGPTISCTDGAMTRKISIDVVNGSAAVVGSVHLFTFDNPTSGSTQTITPAAAATGATMNLVCASECYSGVDLAAGLSVVSNASPTAALSLPFTGMAAGVIPVMAAAFIAPPLGYNMDAIRLDGITSAFALPQYLLFADKFDVSALTAADTNATNPYGAVGFILKAA